jgi:hypothetical protein
MVFQPNDTTNRTHGASHTPLYRTYRNIKNRCYYQKSQNYSLYGGRGIGMSEEWRESFAPFQEWALANGYQDGLTIDRIDGEKGYSPENCRWVTQKINNRNRSVNMLVTIGGVTKCLVEWSEDPACTVKYATVKRRIELGWPVQRAIFDPKMIRL